MAPAHADHIRLLVVDDVEDNRVLLSRRFSKRGFEVIEADCGSAALDLIARQPFDLVLLDIMMPGLDGLEVLKTIRLDHSPDDLPVIMVTAKASNSDVVEALGLGANDYITKPIDFPVAFARVQTQLARQTAQRALALSMAELVETNRRLALEITERKRSEDRVHHMTHHDALTGLGNRVLFHEQLGRAMQRADRDDASLAVLFLDLDDFKLINDTLGHAIGDKLLATVGERLRNCMDDSGTVARVGSDEFAIIQTSLSKPEDAGRLADRIADAIASPCNLEGHQVVVDCSIGIALAPNDGGDPDVLLSNAHLAMHRAKAAGRRSCCFFEAGMNARAQARRTMEADLRQALSAQEFELVYQPLFNLAAGAISGFEALLRWRHPERGMISPADFIPLAEDIGLIVPLGAWVLQQACAEAASWPAAIKLAVNISSVQFRGRGLVPSVIAALAASGLAADRLELEITESVLLDNNDDVIGILHDLRGMGIGISMDDFGTGYSSLSYLRMFPFDKLKIDQSFIRDLDGQNSTMAIVRAVTSLAGSLGMVTTAEGVETKAQLDWLQAEGCTEVQGYLISRPVPPADVPALIAARRMSLRVA